MNSAAMLFVVYVGLFTFVCAMPESELSNTLGAILIFGVPISAVLIGLFRYFQ